MTLTNRTPADGRFLEIVNSPPAIMRALASYDTLNPEDELNDDLPAAVSGHLVASGVLVPLVEGYDDGLSVILIKRSDNLRHHPGQIGFPGGKIENHDRDSLAAALRETDEEIGIGPDRVTVLGSCPEQSTSTGFMITPHVALVDPDTHFAPTDSEVDEVFLVPFVYLADSSNYAVIRTSKQHVIRRYYVINHGHRKIWGATARILFGLARHLESHANCV